MPSFFFLRFLCYFLVGLVVLSPLNSAAENGGKEEVSVAIKSLNYVRALDKQSDKTIRIAVIYNPNYASSLSEARSIEKVISEVSEIRAGQLIAEAVSVNDFRKNQNDDVIFITHGLESYFSSITKFTLDHKIYTLSNDVKCVEDRLCAVAVQKHNDIEVILNESNLRDLGYDLDSAFKYLATRI